MTVSEREVDRVLDRQRSPCCEFRRQAIRAEGSPQSSARLLKLPTAVVAGSAETRLE